MSNKDIKTTGNVEPVFQVSNTPAISTNGQVPGVEGLNQGAYGGLSPHTSVNLPASSNGIQMTGNVHNTFTKDK